MERTYTIPLRRGFINTPRHYRTQKAVSTLRIFLAKHMKAPEENVRIGQHLNRFMWLNGIRNPPARVTVTVKKGDDGIVYAELEGKAYKDTPKPKEREEKPQGLKEKIQAAVKGKKADAEETPQEAAEESPVAEPEAPKADPAPKAKKAPKKRAAKKSVKKE